MTGSGWNSGWLNQVRPDEDECDHLDQVVLVRIDNGQLHLPVYPNVTAGLPDDEQGGTWSAIHVDRPLDAFGHARAVHAQAGGHTRTGECRACPDATLVSGSLTDALEAARAAGARTPSR